MKKYRLLSLLLLPSLIIGCSPSSNNNNKGSSSSEEEIVDDGIVNKNVEVKMVSHFSEDFGNTEYTDTCLYNDAWFLEDSTTINYDVAVLSAMTGGMSYSNDLDNNGTKITSFLNEVGYTNIEKNQYYITGTKLEDSIGVVIGSKVIKDSNHKPYTLLAVFPRNAGYGAEWVGNFNMGTSGIHQGFLLARDEVLRFMKHYIDTHQITGELKIWSAGYSRGAATINLVGGFLAEDNGYFGNNVSITPNNVHIYTIGTPRNVPTTVSKQVALSVSGPRGTGYLDTNVPAYTYQGQGNINPIDNKYNCIHNFVATGDYITKLPSADWGFTRYGQTIEITYGEEDMLNYLKELSPETAEKFKDKNYTTQLSTKSFDLQTFEIVDTNKKISPDQMIEQRISALTALAGQRDQIDNTHYLEVLGAVTAIYGTDWNTFYQGVMGDTTSLMKAGMYNYFSYVQEETKLEDKEAVSEVLKQFMTLAGKRQESEEVYTDQQFLSDLLDYLINDYQTNENARARTNKIAALLPEAFRPILIELMEHAKTNNIQVHTADDVIYLLASYIKEHDDNSIINALITLLMAKFPDQYVSLVAMFLHKTYDEEDETAKKRHIIRDLIVSFVDGIQDEDGNTVATAEQMRYLVLSLVGSMTLSDYPNIKNLILNGAYEGNTDYPDGKVHNDPVPLSEVVDELLTLMMDKDEEGKRLSLKAAADKSLVEILTKGKSETNGKYVDILLNNLDDARKIVIEVLLMPGAQYSLRNDIDNAVTLIDMIQFLFPAHNHEMYISYLKTKCSWASVKVN